MKHNIRKISSRQDFDLSPNELDKHILKMILAKAEEYSEQADHMSTVMQRLVAGIQDQDLRDWIFDAVYGINKFDDFQKRIYKEILRLEDK